MIRIERTFDKALIKTLWSVPYLFNQLIDDGCTEDTFGSFLVDPKTRLFFIVYNNDSPIGIIQLSPKNNTTVVGHIGFLQSGENVATKACHLVIEWLKKNTKIKKIVTEVRDDTLKARRLCDRLGFKVEGYSPNSLIKNNQNIGLTYMGFDIWAI